MIDPRPAVVARRLAGIRRLLVVASGKGGVGKTTCAALAALRCAASGLRTTLLDLDFHGASCHTLLGCSPGLPQEAGGILPLAAATNLELVSIASFTGERPAPLRGVEASSALLEVLAVTVWGERDVLIVDMPPGLGDLVLDMIRLLPRAEIVVVTTPSQVAVTVVARLLALLEESSVAIAGIIVNMSRDARGRERRPPGLDGRFPVLGFVPLDPGMEEAVGSPAALAGSAAAEALDPLVRGILRGAGTSRFSA